MIKSIWQQLNEDAELYKGIFWIPDIDNPNKDYCFKIYSNADGDTIQDPELQINAKSGNTYNHKETWKKLPSSLTKNHKYNYYPRGRVEIHNQVAKIFLNGNINIEEIIYFIKKEFNLTLINGIKKVTVIEDNSFHYLCYLDDGWKEDRS